MSEAVRKLGEYKTIEQRERGRRAGAGRRRRGSVNMWLGGLGALSTGPRGAAQSRVIQSPIRHGMVSDGRTVYRFNGAGERVKASAKLASHLPMGTARLLGTGIAGYGAAQYVTGRGQQHYNDAKLREQRRANMTRQKKPVKKNLSFGGGGSVGHREPVEKAGMTAATAASSVVRAGRRSAVVGRKVTPTAIPSLASMGGRRVVAKGLPQPSIPGIGNYDRGKEAAQKGKLKPGVLSTPTYRRGFKAGQAGVAKLAGDRAWQYNAKTGRFKPTSGDPKVGNPGDVVGVRGVYDKTGRRQAVAGRTGMAAGLSAAVLSPAVSSHRGRAGLIGGGAAAAAAGAGLTHRAKSHHGMMVRNVTSGKIFVGSTARGHRFNPNQGAPESKGKVKKVNRALSPEARRQRRLGAEVAGGLITGGLLARTGVRRNMARTNELRERAGKLGEVLRHKETKIVSPKRGQAGEEDVTSVTDAHREAASSPHRMVATPNRRELAYVGGGSGLAGLSGVVGHRARRDRNGAWY